MYLFIIIITCGCGCERMPQCTCGEHRIAFVSHFSTSPLCGFLGSNSGHQPCSVIIAIKP